MITCLLFANNSRFTDQIVMPSGNKSEYKKGRENQKDKKEKQKKTRRQKYLDILNNKKQHVAKILKRQDYIQAMVRTEEHFDKELKIFIDLLQSREKDDSNNHLTNLATRLDYNRYYSKR